LLNTAPLKKEKKKKLPAVVLEKKLSSALRRVKYDLVLLGRETQNGKVVVIEINSTPIYNIDSLLLAAMKTLGDE